MEPPHRAADGRRRRLTHLHEELKFLVKGGKVLGSPSPQRRRSDPGQLSLRRGHLVFRQVPESAAMEPTQEYDDKLVALLEALWGDGYLSPGGDDETAMVLDGLDLRRLAGARHRQRDRWLCVLHRRHFGRGECDGRRRGGGRRGPGECRCRGQGRGGRRAVRGGASRDRCRSPTAASTSCSARTRSSTSPTSTRWPPRSLACLAPGGVFACSDWMKGDDAPKSPALVAYEALEGLGFGLASPDVYFAALRAAGFEHITYVDRFRWLADKTRSRARGARRSAAAAARGRTRPRVPRSRGGRVACPVRGDRVAASSAPATSARPCPRRDWNVLSTPRSSPPPGRRPHGGRNVTREPAAGGLLVLLVHVAAGVAHGGDGLVQRHEVRAVAVQRQAARR